LVFGPPSPVVAAALLGVAPHLVLLGWFGWPPIVFWDASQCAYALDLTADDVAGAPYATYSWAELFIVPVTLLLVIVLAVRRRGRPWALWLLLGTLAGATAVLTTLATAAAMWRFQR
jgi:hypothetical protein